MAERPGLHVVKMEYVYRSIECALSLAYVRDSCHGVDNLAEEK